MQISAIRRRKMFELVRKHQSGNLTIAQFCRKHKINQWVFWYWKKKLVCKDASPMPVKSQKEPLPQVAFHPVRSSTEIVPGQGGKIEIHYPSGVQVDIPDTYDPARLKILIGAS